MSADGEQVAFQKPGDLVERNEESGAMTMESLCMNCHENGRTTFLLIRIPYFRDVILEAFECEHCHFKNNSIKSASQIQEKGSIYHLEVENEADLQRQVVRSDVSVFKLESLGIEMPKGEGQLTTVEGVIRKIHESLSSEQDLRKEQAPELYEALVPIIAKLEKILESDASAFPFTISLDDPTGNSWIAPTTSDAGHKYRRRDYLRTHEQNEELGIAGDPNAVQNEQQGNPEDEEIVPGQVYSLPAECPACAKPCTVNMKQVEIPHFKEVLVFGTNCDHCGYKSSDVKTGGSVPEKGKRITLRVENEVDLARDILKSDTCALSSEELEVRVEPGTLGGRFTTVEGLLTEIRDQLHGQIFDFADTSAGDSLADSDKEKWDRFFKRLDLAISGELKFNITLEDPMASSYVQDLCAPAKDEQITTEEYTRTEEEEEELGLKDMKTEGYEADADQKEEEKPAEQ